MLMILVVMMMMLHVFPSHSDTKRKEFRGYFSPQNKSLRKSPLKGNGYWFPYYLELVSYYLPKKLMHNVRILRAINIWTIGVFPIIIPLPYRFSNIFAIIGLRTIKREKALRNQLILEQMNCHLHVLTLTLYGSKQRLLGLLQFYILWLFIVMRH